MRYHFKFPDSKNSYSFKRLDITVDLSKNDFCRIKSPDVVGNDTDTDDYLSDIPPLNGLAGVRFHLENGTKRFWLELEGQFFDKQDRTAPGENDTAGYSVCNIRSGMKMPAGFFENITLTLNVENLFDKKYHDHLRLHKRYLYEPGLNVLAGLKIEF